MVMLALPKELNEIFWIQLVSEYARKFFVSKNFMTDINIYANKDNPIAYIMSTMRPIVNDVFLNKPRNEKNIFFKYNTKSNPSMKTWSEEWEQLQNNFFEKNNIDLRVDPGNILPEVKEGRINKGSHYLKEVNEETKKANINIILKEPVEILRFLTARYGNFTENDIFKIYKKAIKSDDATVRGCAENLLRENGVYCTGKNKWGRALYSFKEAQNGN